ncbi:MAG: hypothetical protein LBT20_01775 [Clostridiales bacterium]|jgi:hypothetical protein|nr:hypothetical protein [Clostridiales bacterium]
MHKGFFRGTVAVLLTVFFALFSCMTVFFGEVSFDGFAAGADDSILKTEEVFFGERAELEIIPPDKDFVWTAKIECGGEKAVELVPDADGKIYVFINWKSDDKNEKAKLTVQWAKAAFISTAYFDVIDYALDFPQNGESLEVGSEPVELAPMVVFDTETEARLSKKYGEAWLSEKTTALEENFRTLATVTKCAVSMVNEENEVSETDALSLLSDGNGGTVWTLKDGFEGFLRGLFGEDYETQEEFKLDMTFSFGADIQGGVSCEYKTSVDLTKPVDGSGGENGDGENGDGENGDGENGGENGDSENGGENGDGENGGENGDGENGDENGDGENGDDENGDGDGDDDETDKDKAKRLILTIVGILLGSGIVIAGGAVLYRKKLKRKTAERSKNGGNAPTPQEDEAMGQAQDAETIGQAQDTEAMGQAHGGAYVKLKDTTAALYSAEKNIGSILKERINGNTSGSVEEEKGAKVQTTDGIAAQATDGIEAQTGEKEPTAQAAKKHKLDRLFELYDTIKRKD